MGIVKTHLRVINPKQPHKSYEGEFLVDTGAQYTVLPKKVWQDLGLTPHRSQRFSLADGTVIERKIGGASIVYKNIESVTPVVLGEPKDDLIVGVVTLENLGLGINPFTREIYPAKLMM